MSSRAPRPSWTHLPGSGDLPPTLLDWLASRFPRIDRETWRGRFARELILDADSRPLRADAPCRHHLRVGYFREVADHESDPPATADIRLIHVDAHLVVADKPPFLPVVPGGRHVRECLLYRVEEMLDAAHGELVPIHRLDRATSGLVLFARCQEDRGAYGALFAEARLERHYEAAARVRETPAERSWDVESRIVRGEPFFRMQESDGPANARTRVELLKLESPGGGERVGRFALRPQTGKKHQLRLHMARLGFPILGDRLYPELLPEAPDDPSAPLRLVAKRLVFRDPVSGEARDFVSTRDIVQLDARP